jgi:hypothetical protein
MDTQPTTNLRTAISKQAMLGAVVVFYPIAEEIEHHRQHLYWCCLQICSFRLLQPHMLAHGKISTYKPFKLAMQIQCLQWESINVFSNHNINTTNFCICRISSWDIQFSA